jgi:hypothetical protein
MFIIFIVQKEKKERERERDLRVRSVKSPVFPMIAASMLHSETLNNKLSHHLLSFRASLLY